MAMESMIDTERLFNRLREIAEEEFGLQKGLLGEETVVRDAPVSFDALMMVELMFAIEEEFANCDFEFDNAKFSKCITFGDIVRLTQAYVEGKESELESDYEAQDANKAACEQDGDCGSWLSEGTEPIRKHKQRSRKVASREKPLVREAREHDREMAVGIANPIRKVQRSEEYVGNGANERHGRYHRRESNVGKAEVDGVVRANGCCRPSLGRESRREGSLETRRNEQHPMED